MKFSTTTSIEFKKIKDAKRYYKCLKPEFSNSKRGEISIKQNNNKLIITINAERLTTIKALINSQIKLLEVIEKTEKVITE